MLEIRNINKSYRSKRGSDCHAVKDISIDFGSKGLIFILGKSGSGKSTLLNLMSGLDRADSGEVIIADKSCKDFKARDFDVYRNTYVGFVFQEFSIIEDFNINENILLSLDIQGKKPSEQEISDALARVGLEDYGNRKPNELSGGQKQRVAIARALIKDPKIVFADEPTGNLDSATGKMVLDIFKELSKTRLVIVVSHDTDSALIYADRIIELSDGRVFKDITKTADVDLTKIKMEYQEKIDACFVETRTESGEKPQFIRLKSRLPVRRAARIGVSSFGVKKVRFAFTMLIAIISLTIFGVALNVRDFDYYQSSLISFEKMNINTLQLSRYRELTEEEIDAYSFGNRPRRAFKESDLKLLEEEGITPSFVQYYRGLSLNRYAGRSITDRRYSLNTQVWLECTKEKIDRDALNSFYGSKLIAGDYPEYNDEYVEILISDFTADSCIFYGVNFSDVTLYPDSFSHTDLVGKTFKNYGVMFKIAGVFSTDYERVYTQRRLSPEGHFKMNAIYSAIMVLNGAATEMYTRENFYSIYANATAIAEDNEVGMRLTMFDLHTYEKPSGHTGLSEDRLKFIEGYDRETVLQRGDILISVSKFNQLFIDGKQNEVSFDDLDINHYRNYILRLSFVMSSSDVDYYHNFRVVGIFDDRDGEEINEDTVNLAIIHRSDFITAVNEDYLPQYVYISINSKNKAGNEVLLRYFDEVGFGFFTPISNELIMFNNLFIYITDFFDMAALVLFILVAMLLYNFISSSIAGKKKEIGILRAMGARGVDVAKIFAVEGIIICALCLTFSLIFTIIGVVYVNGIMVSNMSVPLELITLNPLTLVVTFLTCVTAVAAASFIPLYLIIRQKPIDSIKNL